MLERIGIGHVFAHELEHQAIFDVRHTTNSEQANVGAAFIFLNDEGPPQ